MESFHAEVMTTLHSSSRRPRRFGGGKGGESREAKVSKKKPLPASVASAILATTAEKDR